MWNIPPVSLPKKFDSINISVPDCSRYWKCDMDEDGKLCDLCLLECDSCPGGPPDPNCDGQEALTFDPSY